MSVAVVILTYNEILHISRAIESVSGFATEIFVIDSGSTDGTADVARQMGANVLTNPFVNQAQQFQWAMDNAPIGSDWVMRLDADEVIEPGLSDEIKTQLPGLPPEITGVNLKRKHIFMDRWIKHGGRYPLIMLRIWRRGKARIEQRWMDEHIYLLEGRYTTFDGVFSDHNLNDLTYFVDKHNKYATREAIDVISKTRRLSTSHGVLSADATSTQASRKRQVKEQLYNRLPFWIASTGYFLYRYIFQLGILDGKEGLIYHGLQGGWYRFMVGAKVLELERLLRQVKEPEAVRTRLSELTGFRL